jgi:DNA-directed RNA polymerase subunit E'/Rpb7
MNDKSEKKIYGIFIRSVLTRKVILSINEIGKNIKQNLEQKIVEKNEGKCVSEGFIRPNSVKIIHYSSGLIMNENVEFQTVFECMVSYPVEGQIMECTVKTITKAGIHAEVIIEDGIVPVTVFIARDHHNTDKYFTTIKENAYIIIRVIGVRFELNDPYICVIGNLMDKMRMEEKQGERKKAGLSRLIVHED